ncbi:Sensor histidine kinase LiaS [Rubripirellula obstinata]|uniref:histidine kinase n=2 Tax=Rubripirellula obstinata TaxID=406547 RepID=A0A5B1CIN5_9BACT|nr:ATP-binding protein [Rubripirellula obstinata]KAA1259589.1 Sensor histidine kinase LiaS [Rubripirellula obstinata]
MIDAEAALLGSEIHDELMPLLFASSANVHRLLRELDPETGEEHLGRLRDVAQWLDQAMESGRQMIGGVFPPDFQTQSWHQFSKARLIELNVPKAEVITWSVDETASLIESETAFAAMRITVEACRNAICHGQATQVDVQAAAKNGKFTVSIQDNGIGFDPEQIPEGHFGLKAMKQRATHAGGELLIESKPGSGTRIVFAIS